MTRANDFVDKVYKWINTLWDNKPKDMSFFVYIYVRDINAKSEKRPDGEIRCVKMAMDTKYDEYRIRQDMDEFFMQKAE